jgi:hypothetical protein
MSSSIIKERRVMCIRRKLASSGPRGQCATIAAFLRGRIDHLDLRLVDGMAVEPVLAIVALSLWETAVAAVCPVIALLLP